MAGITGNLFELLFIKPKCRTNVQYLYTINKTNLMNKREQIRR